MLQGGGVCRVLLEKENVVGTCAELLHTAPFRYPECGGNARLKKRRKPSKILTASGIASSAEKVANFDVLPYVYIKSFGFGNRNLGILQAYLPENEPKKKQKAGKMGV